MRSLIRTLLALVAGVASTAVAAPPADWPTKIRFGVVPTEGGADTTRRFEPLGELLSRELGVPVEVVSASTYQGVITAMANEQVEFAWFGPKSYLEAARRADAEALLIELNADGERGYRCIFIVPAGSAIRSLDDARGRKFAFTDPNSTSGRLIPAMILLETTKVAPERYFGSVTHSGSHGTSILQTAAGELEIAVTNDLDLRRMIQKGAVRESDLRIIHTSELIPGAPIAVRRKLPETLKQAFVAAMKKVNGDPKMLEILQNGGFATVRDEEYDILRAADEFVKEQEKAAGR
jgi:phosphonate transport system substrate-binding protein